MFDTRWAERLRNDQRDIFLKSLSELQPPSIAKVLVVCALIMEAKEVQRPVIEAFIRAFTWASAFYFATFDGDKINIEKLQNELKGSYAAFKVVVDANWWVLSQVLLLFLQTSNLIEHRIVEPIKNELKKIKR